MTLDEQTKQEPTDFVDLTLLRLNGKTQEERDSAAKELEVMRAEASEPRRLVFELAAPAIESLNSTYQGGIN